MVILVDMDDTLTTLGKPWIDYLNETYGTSVKMEDIDSWSIHKFFPEIPVNLVYKALSEPDIWRNINPLPGAIEAIKKLQKEHDVYVVTSAQADSIPYKEKALLKYFKTLNHKHIIYTQNKQMIKGDILIDDGPHNLKGFNGTKILFDKWHNKSFDEKSIKAHRAYSWHDILDLIYSISIVESTDSTTKTKSDLIEYPHAHYFKCSNCKQPIPYKFGMISNGKRKYEYCPKCGKKFI